MVYPDPKRISKIKYKKFRVRVNHTITHNQTQSHKVNDFDFCFVLKCSHISNSRTKSVERDQVQISSDLNLIEQVGTNQISTRAINILIKLSIFIIEEKFPMFSLSYYILPNFFGHQFSSKF